MLQVGAAGQEIRLILSETGAAVIERGDICNEKSVNYRIRGSFRTAACASIQEIGLVSSRLGYIQYSVC